MGHSKTGKRPVRKDTRRGLQNSDRPWVTAGPRQQEATSPCGQEASMCWHQEAGWTLGCRLQSPFSTCWPSSAWGDGQPGALGRMGKLKLEEEGTSQGSHGGESRARTALLHPRSPGPGAPPLPVTLSLSRAGHPRVMRLGSVCEFRGGYPRLLTVTLSEPQFLHLEMGGGRQRWVQALAPGESGGVKGGRELPGRSAGGRLKGHLRGHVTGSRVACTSGQSPVVTLLIGWRCDLNARDKEGKTALIKVCSSQPILLEQGADTNLADDFQNTALHYAVLAGNTSVAAELLRYDANIEAINEV
ncbi:putative ankyrin repeat domain-containing protein 20A5 [Camelus dromedarius]|uniref:Putative ankyrin repeat domain-containing protein 20A5 n=1 Tax=Camelus dromedarius TaxID=9838 RepID=A0A5N4C0U8_CAMDR|nr:putative ankyrin repeat domain-containing protein 20A5 [Camelus dromedarius]